MITVVLLLMILAVVVAVVTLKLRPRGGAWCVREKAGRHGGGAGDTAGAGQQGHMEMSYTAVQVGRELFSIILILLIMSDVSRARMGV